MSSNPGYEYYRDENGNIHLDEEIEVALSTVIEYVNEKSLSLREAASFLSETTGKPVTHEGLRKIIRRRA